MNDCCTGCELSGLNSESESPDNFVVRNWLDAA
jgi:hypothetical protein